MPGAQNIFLYVFLVSFYFCSFPFLSALFYFNKTGSPANQWAASFPRPTSLLIPARQNLPLRGKFLSFFPRDTVHPPPFCFHPGAVNLSSTPHERREHPRAWTRTSHVASKCSPYKPPSPGLKTLGASSSGPPQAPSGASANFAMAVASQSDLSAPAPSSSTS